MSIARLALRLAVIEALAPPAQYSAATPAWPTLAQGRVGDSDNPPEDEIAPRAVAIRVYTDETEAEADPGEDIVASRTGPRRAEEAMLAVEILVPGLVEIETGPATALAVETDALAEALLDLTESQVVARLAFAETQAALPKVLSRIRSIKSQPWRDADTNARMSARRMEFMCEITPDAAWPAFTPGTPGDAGVTPLLDRLAEPLRSVGKALAEGGYGRQLCETLAAHIGQPAAQSAFDEMRLAANLARAAGDAVADDPDASATPPEGDVGGSVPL